MKKILLATTVLAMTATVAAAEVTISGSAQMGLKYNGGAAANKTTLNQEVAVTFGMSGATDGGLEFGATLPLLAGDESSIANDGSSVYISGAFGKLTFGSVGEADEVATLSDMGYAGVGTDDVAEAFSGDSVGKFATLIGVAAEDFVGWTAGDTAELKAAIGSSHNVNYSHSIGDLSVSASGLLGESNESAAFGVKYAIGNAYIGLGYNSANFKGAVAIAAGVDPLVESLKTDATSVFVGGTFDAFKVAAMYTDFQAKLGYDGVVDSISGKAYGVTGSYSMDALTVSAAWSKAELDGVSSDAYGVGVAYDLGGGATVTGGMGRIADTTKADMGVKFSF